MKKVYFLLGALFLSGSVFSQQKGVNRLLPTELSSQSAKKTNVLYNGSEAIQVPLKASSDKAELNAGNNRAASYTEWIVGNTIYDLQSNGSVQNRIVVEGENKSVAFTYSDQTSQYTDRGTGYNYTNELIWGETAVERLESQRVGWPSILYTGSGSEVVITHKSSGGLSMVKRDIGTGEWTESTIETSAPEGLVWPRAVSGGVDGNIIHVIAVTAPLATQEPSGTDYTFQGLDGALVYFRSTDEGETWDIQDSVLAPLDTSNFLGFRGDSYSIFARGDKVAFGVFDDWQDSFMMISEDNGDNWEYTSLVDFPVDLHPFDEYILDLDEDGIADTLSNTDGCGAVFIDSYGMTHALYGNMRYMDDDIGDDQSSYFPYTDGLEHWNEAMGPDSSQTIAFMLDLDESGELEVEDEVGLYFVSLCGMPQMGEDEDGNLYVSYSGMVETHSTGQQNYRHVYLLKSEDGGATWTDPVDFTPDLDYIGFEAVFASMAPIVDEYIHITYQRDLEPGLHVRGDEDPSEVNDIMYMRVTPDLVDEEIISVEEITDDSIVEIFPNPATNELNILTPDLRNCYMSLRDITGKKVLEGSGIGHLNTFDVSQLSSGLYLLNIHSGTNSKTYRVVID